jgi:hypothetical protein
MDFIDIGWREGLLLAVVVVAVYLVVALLGLARLKRRREAVAVAPPPLVAGEPPDFLASSLSVRIDDDRLDVPGPPACGGDGRSPIATLAWHELETRSATHRWQLVPGTDNLEPRPAAGIPLLSVGRARLRRPRRADECIAANELVRP